MAYEELKPWLRLGLPLSVLVFYTSSSGVFRPEIYRLETPIYAAQGIGQDVANLTLIFPFFLVSWWYAWKGSMRAPLVHLGILLYLVYSYAMYAVTVHFNTLFLMYTAALGLSLYSMVGLLINVDTEALRLALTRSSSYSALRLSLAALFVFMACLFSAMWLAEIIPHLLDGTVPESIKETGLPSNMVHVLDLGVVLPFFLLSAVLVLKGHRAGFLFAPVILNFSLCMTTALMSMIVFMYSKGFAESMKPAALFAVIFLLNLRLNVLYLKCVPST